MPSDLSLSGSQLLVVGDDGNDWTGPEPLAVVDLDGSVVDVDPSELTAWVPPPLEEKDEIPRMVDAPRPSKKHWSMTGMHLQGCSMRWRSVRQSNNRHRRGRGPLAALTQDGPQTASSAFSVDLVRSERSVLTRAAWLKCCLRPRWRAHLNKA